MLSGISASIIALIGGGIFWRYRYNKKKRSQKNRINCPKEYKEQLKRCLQRAEKLFAKPELIFTGQMKVIIKQGTANTGSFWGIKRRSNSITGAYITYRPSSKKMEMHLFTNPQGHETDREIIHEWGHGILVCYPAYWGMEIRQQHRIMAQHGFPFAK